MWWERNRKKIYWIWNERKVFYLIKIILSLKFGGNVHSYKFNNSLDEFIQIILFTQGYDTEIKSLLQLFLNMKRYFQNINEEMIK